MVDGQDEVERWWHAFLASLPPGSDYADRYRSAEGWGRGPEMADELGGLIVQGTKTATCSSLWEWQAEGGRIPQPGDLTMVLDGKGGPMCIIETVEVTIRRFGDVDERFAFEEGEGDRSLRYWREAHRHYFGLSHQAIGREFHDDVPLVCERFRVVFQCDSSNK